jgi:tetratricopeptide (TPR) repeat protein
MEARRYDDCIRQTRKALELDANFPAAFLTLAIANHIMGRYDDSIEAYARFGELCGSSETAATIRESYARGGWEGFLKAMTAPEAANQISNYIIAVFHAALGDHEGAIAKLEASFEVRESYIVMLKIDPRLDALRDSARFQELYKKIGFPEVS